MVKLGKPQVHAKFEVASFSRCTNIKEKPQNFGSSSRPRHVHIFFRVGFYNGPWQNQAVYQI